MSVKILTTTQKELIGHLYRNENMPVKYLALHYKCSQRTIYTVLKEIGLNKRNTSPHVTSYQPEIVKEVVEANLWNKIKTYLGSIFSNS
jgi:transcriptional antiterminator